MNALSFVLLLVGVCTFVSCDDKSAPQDVPAGWVEFDFGAVTGVAPEHWSMSVVSLVDFTSLWSELYAGLYQSLYRSEPVDGVYQAGVLDEGVLSAVEEVSIEKLESAGAFSGQRQLLGLGVDGGPIVQVQLCAFDEKPIRTRDGDEAVADFAKNGASVLGVVGEVQRGDGFAVLEFDRGDERLVLYYAVIREKSCTSVAMTMAVDPGDDSHLKEFETFLALLRVSN